MASELTPSIRVQTNVPFPTFRANEDGVQELVPDASDKIVLESCSEFMDFDIAGSQFGSTDNFILLHDLEGQPLILSIGTDKHLYLCAYVNGGSGSWQTFDITPTSNFEATVCDASKSPNNKSILIAVSGYDQADKSRSRVYHAVFECPTLVADEKGNVQAFEALPWRETSTLLASRQVNSLICEYFGGESAYRIVVGVAATTLEGSHYIYDPSVGDDFVLVRFPLQVEKIRSVIPANLPALGPGYVVLFEDNTARRNISCFFQGDGVSKQIYLTGLENPTKLSASVNRRGYTDILIAAGNGIGFIDHKRLTESPTILLPSISCSTAIASEHGTSPTSSTLTIFALTTHGELYVLPLPRSPGLQPPPTHPLPIRTSLHTLSARTNPLTHSLDLILATRDTSSSALHHLTRDRGSGLWKQTTLLTGAQKKKTTTRTPCFLTTLSFTSSATGAPVPRGYSVRLMCEAQRLVYVNGRSYTLTPRAQRVGVDAGGRVQLVIPATGGLSAEAVGVGLGDEGEVCWVQPAQRVLRMLGGLGTKGALREARDEGGRRVFGGVEEEVLEGVAGVLGRLPVMVERVERGGGGEVGEEEVLVAWEKNGTGKVRVGGDWLSEAVEFVGGVIGDAVEFLRAVVKGVVKVVMKVVGPVVRLFLKIGAKVIRLVLDSVSSIVEGLASLLEGVFGLDLSALRAWFSFRYKRVEATQKEIASVIQGGLALTSRFLHHNHDMLNANIDSLGRYLEQFISKPFPNQNLSQSSTFESSIFNNPIIANLLKFNPLSWILEAINEELSEDIQIPTLNLNITSTVLHELGSQIDILINLLKRSFTGFYRAGTNPSEAMQHLTTVAKDSFWTLFGALKQLLLTLYSLLTSSFDNIASFCTAPWTIPGLTDIWEELTQTPFSLLNFISYLLAQLIELFNPSSKPAFTALNLALAPLLDASRAGIKMPSLLPSALAADLKAYSSKNSIDDDEDDAKAAWEAQVRATATAQDAGTAYLAAHPVTEPRFGLMANTAPIPELKREKEPRLVTPAPDAARFILALVRSGKGLSRTAGVAFEGLMVGGSSGGSGGQGGSQGGGSGSGSGSVGGSGEVEMVDLGSLGKSGGKLEAGALDEAFEGLSSGKLADGMAGFAPPAVGAKAALIANAGYGFCCRAIEQFVLLNYFEEEEWRAENYDGNSVELVAALLGLVVSCFADSPPAIALSNLLVSGGSFAGSLKAPEKDFFRIADMVGSGCSVASSILFLVKEPTCQTIAWVGVAIDGGNAVMMMTNQLRKAVNILTDSPSKPSTTGDQGPTTGTGQPTTGAIPQPSGPKTDQDEKPKEPKKQRKVVDQPADAKARDIEILYETLRVQDVATWNPTGFAANPNAQPCQPLCDLLQYHSQLDLVKHRRDHAEGLAAAAWLRRSHQGKWDGSYYGEGKKNLVKQVSDYYVPRIAMSEVPGNQDFLERYLKDLTQQLKTISDRLDDLVYWMEYHWEVEEY